MYKIIQVVVLFLFISGCAGIERKVIYRLSCDKCKTPYGSGEKIEMTVIKQLDTKK